MTFSSLRSLAALFAMTVLISACQSSSNSDSSTQQKLDKMVDQQWTDFKQEHAFSKGGMGVRLLTPNGDYFVHQGFETKSETETLKSATINTHFRGASTAKTFTAAAIMMMHQQGLLNIDDTLDMNIPKRAEPYLPDTAGNNIPYKDSITIRQLLQHRAGVFDVKNNPIPEDVDQPYAGQYYADYVMNTLGEDHTFTLEEFIAVDAVNQLSSNTPNAEFHYSNTGYAILGKIIERISGLSYSEYIQQTFLEPLNLNDTRFPDLGTDQALPEPYVEGYTIVDDEELETTFINLSASVAEGNIMTTPENLTRWLHLLQTYKAGLNKETVSMMNDVILTGEAHYAYGLGITFTEGLGYGHDGAQMGYLTTMRYDPKTDVTVLVFTSAILADERFMDHAMLLVDVAKDAKSIVGY
ncbi:MAG: serine hydrolase domain-containing protein [Hydrogenovibrio sp.]